LSFKKTLYRIYKMTVIRVMLLSFFMTASFFSFSQRQFTDTTSAGTVVEDSVTGEVDTTGYYQDSVDKADYNYYNDTAVWPKDTFLLRQVPDSVINGLQSQDDFWYANKEFKKKKAASERPMNLEGWLAGKKWYRVLAWFIIIGGFLAVLIWYLASSNVGIFSRRSKVIAKTDDAENNENIFEINYQKEIDRAIQEHNYRLAVRLMFLRALKNLSEKNVIQFKHGRTNFDYLVQVNNTGYYKDFFRLTRHYEYMWYGEFGVSNETFAIIKREFENFDRQLY